jgi:hypothetical protein
LWYYELTGRVTLPGKEEIMEIVEIAEGWLVKGKSDIYYFFSPFKRDAVEFVNSGKVDYPWDYLVISRSFDIWELFEFVNKEMITHFTSDDREKVFQKAIELIYSGKFRYVIFL